LLRSIRELRGYTLKAKDGAVGRCKDFLFDDAEWTIRYMVADTRKWLPGRKVLIPAASLGEPDWQADLLHVALTRDQIKGAPALDEDEPVSRQYEEAFLEHIGLPVYWVPAGPLGPHAFPAQPGKTAGSEDRPNAGSGVRGDPHLRSCAEVTGYEVSGADGRIGRIGDFIVGDERWILRYIVVDTGSGLPGPGRRILLAPDWLTGFEWARGEARTDLTVDRVQTCPDYNPAEPVNRAYEERLYDYYGRPVYWDK